MEAGSLHPADRLSFDRAVVTQPVWNRMDTAAEAFGLPRNVLLHAGPPFAAPASISRPILNSACVAAVFEGLAADFDAAQALILAGDIILRPAQDHAVVVPLCAVVSASMPLHAIYDAHRGDVRVFAPINGGHRPSMRLGLRSTAVLEHLRWLNGPFCDALRSGIGEGMALVPLAATGLAGGDDCHGRTPVATQALIEELHDRARGGTLGADADAFLAASPMFFLNLWMAATKCMMTLAAGIDGSSFVTAAGGNGVDMGIQLSHMPGRWFTTPAVPPAGAFDIDVPADRAMGAVGDSAIVDAFGLGAMTIDRSPEQRRVLGAFLPGDSESRLGALSIGGHPYFRKLGTTIGMTARSVRTLGAGPMIALGIVDREGEAGRLGSGVYDMPPDPFVAAMAALEG